MNSRMLSGLFFRNLHTANYDALQMSVTCCHPDKKRKLVSSANNGDLSIGDVKYSSLSSFDNRFAFCILNYYLVLPDNLVSSR